MSDYRFGVGLHPADSFLTKHETWEEASIAAESTRPSPVRIWDFSTDTPTEAVIAARKAERPLCPVCNEPVTRMGNRMLGKTCGKTSCRNALQNGVPATPRCACGKPCVNKVGTTRQFQKTCGSKACKTKANSDRMTKVHAERRGEAA